MNFSEGNHDQNNQNNENRNLLFNNLHEHQGLEDFSNVCRTCASIADQVCPIFDDQSLSDDLAGKMNKYLPIKVLKADGLPQVICVQCQHTILAWDELVKCSIQSNMVLQQKLSVMRLLDPGKIEDESEESTKTPIQIMTQTLFKFNDVVREVLMDYFNELNIEEHADLEYVCQFCADHPTSKSIEELTNHLRLIHGTKLQTKQSIEDFIKNNISFEEVLTIDKDESDVESAQNELESVMKTKEMKLQNYCCPFCESVFSSPSRLVYHLNKHIEISISNGIECCEQLYDNKLTFVAHLQDAHVSRTLDEHTCKSCGKISCDFEELQAHINEEHPESNDLNEMTKIVHIATRQKYIPVVCPKCNKTFSNKYNLRVHDVRSHVGEQTTFTCDKCNKTYKSQGSLNYHHKIYHEGILRYLCSLCGEAFPTRGTRNVHARIHTGAKPFECYHCGKSYRAKNTLNRHIDMHLDIRNYACSLCPKKFRKRTHLNYHLRTHENKCNTYETLCVKVEQNNVIKVGNQKMESIQRPKNIHIKDGKKYGVCEICKKSVAIASWRRHSQSHLTVKRYSCHICGLGFNDSGNLSRHRKAVHTEHRPHACNTCHRSFTRNSHLQEHIRTHSDSRDYVCDICGKASKSSAALRMHRKIHLNEYRFHCIYCESRFKRRGELLVHVSVHTGEKAHVCGCGKAFRLRHQLASHTRKHIKEIQTMK